jgi:hypothetical protein
LQAKPACRSSPSRAPILSKCSSVLAPHASVTDGIELEIYCEVPEFDWRRNGMTRVPLDIEGESADQPLTMEQARATKLKLPADL